MTSKRTALLSVICAVLAFLALVAPSASRAAAATQTVYGQPATAVYESSSQGGLYGWLDNVGYWIKCTFGAYWETTGTSATDEQSRVHLQWRCTSGVSVLGDHDHVLEVKAGSGCTLSAGGGHGLAGDDSTGTAVTNYDTGCTSGAFLCLTEEGEDPICIPIALGTPPSLATVDDSPDSGGTCKFGTGKRPTIEEFKVTVLGDDPGETEQLTTMETNVASRWNPSPVDGVGRMYAYLIIRAIGQWTSQRAMSSGINLSAYTPGQRLIAWPVSPTGTAQLHTQYQVPSAFVSWRPEGVIGGGYFYMPTTEPSQILLSTTGATVTSHTQLTSQLIGKTIPSACLFWWGPNLGAGGVPLGDAPVPTEPAPPSSTEPPLIDVPAPGEDCDPDADACIELPELDPEDNPYPSGPGGDDDACDFSITDPTTWGGKLLCVVIQFGIAILNLLEDLLGLAEAIIEAIVGLAAAIAEALIDALTTFLIPPDDLFDDLFDSLGSIGEDIGLNEWTDPLEGGFSAPASGSCTGPVVSLPLPGVSVDDLRPFDACSGQSASAASTVRLVALCVLYVGAAFSCIRMVASSLGIRTATPGTGEGK